MANTIHIEAIRGDYKLLQITVKDVNGNVVDITGYTARFTVRVNPRDASAIIEKTTSSGITLTSPTVGVMQVSLSNDDTTIDARKYVYDVQVTDTLDRTITVARGNFNVIWDSSRA